jgi:EmrB/QacA subfamily drug resistance transporter
MTHVTTAIPRPKRHIDRVGWWVLFATISASSVAFIMQGGLNLVIPVMQDELGASGADILWIVNIYQLILSSLILIGGSLGDRFGRKRIYIIGIIIFTVSATLCGLAESTPLLIIGRAFKGIGGALMVPGSLSIVSAYFDGHTRGKAIGIWSSVTTMTGMMGPILGGIMTDAGLWRGIFFLSIPLAVMALFALVRYVPESRDEDASKGLDYWGAILITLGLGGIVFGATEIGRVGLIGLRDPLMVGALIAGVACLVAFVFVELSSEHPLLSLRLFKSRSFTGANLLTFIVFGTLAVTLFFLPLNLMQIQNYGATAAGLTLLPTTIILIVISPYMGSWVDKRGPRIPLLTGTIVLTLAYLLAAIPGITRGTEDYIATFLPPATLFGIGMGMMIAPLSTTIMGSVSQHYAGVASGVNNTVSRGSGVLAVAIFGGIGLIFFSNAITVTLQNSDLPEVAQQAMMDNAGDLGNTPIPNALTSEQTQFAIEAVKWAFVDMFRLMMLIGAGLSVVAALIAYFMIDERVEPYDERIPSQV